MMAAMSQPIDTMRWFRAGLIAMLALILGAAAGRAADPGASEWVRTDQTAVRLVSAAGAVGTADRLSIGLQFTLKPGWKTYWRSPGDAGLPVTVDWAGSVNVASAAIAWPVPHRFSLSGLDTFGYEDEVVLPVQVHPAKPGDAVALRAKVNYLTCADICIPYEARLSLDLPAGTPTPTAYAQLISRYVARVPGDGASQGLTLDYAAIAHSDGKQALIGHASSTIAPFEKPDVIVEAPQGLAFGAPIISLSQDGSGVKFELPITMSDGASPLDSAEVTLTLVDGARGLEQKFVAGRGFGDPTKLVTAGSVEEPGNRSILVFLLFALLGGLILNVMPCVLPVLSLKLLGLIGHEGESSRHVRLSFLASAAGILTAFAGLAAVLAALKGMGGSVGWGIQFQQPWFLIAMMLVLTLFAGNLWGWFEIPLPAFIGRFAGIGRSGSLAGQFGIGIFATLLATPCSAPFVGTAIGFALARGTGEIFAIFIALGLGFAAPYLLVAALPAIAELLPRPGRWMQVLRRLLGLLLAGTAVWLLAVLQGEIDRAALSAVAGIIVAIVAALWARHHLPVRLRMISPAAVVILALAALAVPTQFAASRSVSTAGDAAGLWRPFDEAAIAKLVGEGKTVFVDVTADWCVTCVVNKRLVVDSAAIQKRLTAANVVAMQADWTQPDDGIARYLAANNRYGIPFNAVYGPGAPKGIVLPELLSEGVVLDALAKASGG
jgi:suppressor for copper-sensitivity B